jgi:hypothetical protein
MNSSDQSFARDDPARRWSIGLLVLGMVGMSGFGLAGLPAWLVCVPFVLLAMQDGACWRRDGGIGARVAGPVFHLVVMATAVVAHGKMADRSGVAGCCGGAGELAGGSDGGCGCGAGRVGEFARTPDGGCGCGAGKASGTLASSSTGCGCAAGGGVGALVKAPGGGCGCGAGKASETLASSPTGCG